MRWYDMGSHVQSIALWVIIIVLAALVIAAVKRSPPSTSGESPEQILKRRYAAGEIDRDTYQRMLADLEQRPDRKEVA